ncbi:hypothetical protein Pla110_38930 [Polystyrenella longa]|uniref:DUF1501 domain-containing protein n=1 Tax=Polystyrenella longa TaxID=2528007 RepID=A0A518CSE2_9PLAN|nr:DUF1501 domain-containing protein [Polystyrenella longa]QDU82138.1 hypothetical protein Pla110_38930 [Polystyrenella longa]
MTQSFSPQNAHQRHHASSDLLSQFGPQGRSLIKAGSRRWFLQMGLGGLAGLSASQLMQQQALAAAEKATSGKNPQAKSVILVWLSGGPSQVDMWDMKPNAPQEIRGPFSPIATSVPGIEICEHLPKQAAMMDKFTLIRSMDATASNHTPVTFQAANPKSQRTNKGIDGGGYPSMGSVTAKFRGANETGMPPYVALADSLAADIYGAGELGHEYEPLDAMKSKGKFDMPAGVQIPRMQDRDQLRQELDRFRKQTETSSSLAFHDRYVQEAYNMVSSGQIADAFDINKEPESVRNEYGNNSFGNKSLLARRLVEAGVTWVTLSDAWGHWDHHGDDVRWGGIEKGLAPMLPEFDHGIATLINDLEERGLLDTTLVLILGEFGRGPVINKQAGRDHWTPTMSMLMAGAGVPGGQVIGKTDRRGGAILERRLGPGDLATTVFTKLGIDPGQYWINHSGRPIPLVEGEAEYIRELS